MTDKLTDMEPATDNPYWTDAGGDHTKVDCPECGEGVDIDGPLEDAHFVFALRWNPDRIKRMERSNLGECPKNPLKGNGFDGAVSRMRFYLGIGKVYYRGHIL